MGVMDVWWMVHLLHILSYIICAHAKTMHALEKIQLIAASPMPYVTTVLSLWGVSTRAMEVQVGQLRYE